MDSNSTEMQRCVLASGNQGKLDELSGVLLAQNIELISQSEFNLTEAIEDGSTFVENALIKAKHASEATGLSAMADDSGIVVPSLNGEPGIRSARYAMTDNTDKPTDQENIDKLLKVLEPMPDTARAAYFVCCLVFVRHAKDPVPVIASGIWHGRILHEAQGEGGFGYDPVFYCPGVGMTAAAMGKAKKSTVSHRAIALKELKHKLSETTI